MNPVAALVNRLVHALVHELRLFCIAVQFLTRVPVPHAVGFEPDWLNQSARHFPAVGWCVGGVAALVLVVAAQIFPPAVAVGLSMAATLCLTGGFHEDGLADTFDALGGAVSRERALAIMKDSRIGSYGAIALVIVLGLKAATLASLSALALAQAACALLLAHTASRSAAVLLIRALAYAGDVDHAKAKPLARRVSAGGTVAAVGWLVLVSAGLVWLAPVHASWVGISLALGGVGALACAAWLRKRLGGYTGDGLGATQQITELLVLLGWLAGAGP